MSPTVPAEDSFGRRLRQERERRQISLASISANTKIGVRLLEGLERDDVSRWPGGIFRRSFVRDYAAAVGLDPDVTAREFVARFPDPSEPPPPAAVEPTHAPKTAAEAGPAQLAADAARPSTGTALRLTLEDTGATFTPGPFLTAVCERCSAVACDMAVIAALGLGFFAALGSFWMPVAATMLVYYAGGILLLGNTPGVCLFAPTMATAKSSPSQRSPSGQKNVKSTLLPAGSSLASRSAT
jgi:transcriptional regulator with XRE-family HTH domain